MALYTPDYDYQNGKKMLEELKGTEGELIRYYVSQNAKFAKNSQDKFDELVKALRIVKEYIR